MIELKMLINEWKKESEGLLFKSKTSFDKEKEVGYYAASMRLLMCITEAELLLKHDESKQPQPPDFANTMLGEVPHGVNDQSGENLKAVEGATPVVRQNEQTKKVCEGCSAIIQKDETFCEACLEDIDEFLEP